LCFENETYPYENDGLVKSVNYGNGMGRSYSYDGADRVTGVVNTVSASVGEEYQYGYDAHGNRVSETRKYNGTTTRAISYEVDSLDRMTSAEYVSGAETRKVSYGYDEVGNRQTEQVAVNGTTTARKRYSYDGVNRLTQVTDETGGAGIPMGNYSYDGNGNLTTQTVGLTVTNYEYDVRGQLRRVTNGASELGRYDYDAQRRRLTRSTVGGATLYVYDGAEVVEESGWDAATQRTTPLNRYEHGLEIVKANLAGEGERYYFSEGQGSVTMLATATQSLAQRTEYEAWGEVLAQTNSSVNAVGYTGARRDSESGLLALGNGERFYNPALGRFIQQDRWSGMAGLAQTLNRYAYGVNNPVRWTDHSGNSPDGMSASDATRIGGGESSAGEFRADSQMVDDSWARGMAQQNAGRSYEENASEVPFTQVMREQTQARVMKEKVEIFQSLDPLIRE
jgi:RHS repeat-associated protein